MQMPCTEVTHIHTQHTHTHARTHTQVDNFLQNLLHADLATGALAELLGALTVACLSYLSVSHVQAHHAQFQPLGSGGLLCKEQLASFSAAVVAAARVRQAEHRRQLDPKSLDSVISGDALLQRLMRTGVVKG